MPLNEWPKEYLSKKVLKGTQILTTENLTLHEHAKKGKVAILALKVGVALAPCSVETSNTCTPSRHQSPAKDS